MLELGDILNKFPDGAPGERARGNFLGLCRAYYSERQRNALLSLVGKAAGNITRSEIHTEIMGIVQRLYLAGSDVMPARYEVGEAIMRFFSKS